MKSKCKITGNQWSLKGKEFRIITTHTDHTKQKVIGIKDGELIFDKKPEITKEEKIYYPKEHIDELRKRLTLQLSIYNFEDGDLAKLLASELSMKINKEIKNKINKLFGAE